MKWIDLSTWKRREQFEMFSSMQSPHYNICANVDVTATLEFCKKNQLSSFSAIAFVLTHVTNETEHFRLRIREDRICVHDSVDPSFTFLKEDDSFGYGTVSYKPKLLSFCHDINQVIRASSTSSDFSPNHTRDDIVYLSCLPWIQFTSITHAMNIPATDSIPRISWGKYFEMDNATMMPLSVQVHHGLADGIHVGRFFETVQDVLTSPNTYI